MSTKVVEGPAGSCRVGRPALKDITKDVSNENDLDSLSGTISEQKLLFDIAPGAHNTGMSEKEIRMANVDSNACAKEYTSDIFAHLQDVEKRYMPDARYMETVQSDVNSAMRGILVDWLVEVADEYKLSSETLFLTVAYVDRCLGVCMVARTQLQLVGITCMLIASKYEEIYAPQVDEFCYITDNTYSREHVLSMERMVLNALDFELTHPTSKTFLRRCFWAFNNTDTKVEFLASFLAELALLEYRLLRFLPSTVAAAAIHLSLLTLRIGSDVASVVQNATAHSEDLKGCIVELHACHVSSQKSSLSAVREKYAQTRFKCVSLITPPELRL